MNWEITKQVVAAIIRWGLAFIGALLVKQGIIDPQLADAWLNEITATLLGLAILAIPVVWKYLNARFNILALIKAVQREPPIQTQSLRSETPAQTDRRVDAAVTAAVADVKAEVKAENSAVLSA